MKIGWLQIIMAVIYMGILIGVGLYMSRKVKSSDDFWIGGRQVGPVATALSYGAAYVSTVAIIGDPPMYYNYGLGYAAFEIMISVFFCCILIFIVFAPKMRALSERLNVVSLSGFLAIRYKSNQFRLLCGTLVSVMMVPYAISAMKGIADAMHAIVGIPYAMGVVVIAVVSFCYLVTAGYWGVSTTDIIQGITIAVSCLLVAVIVITKSGGVTAAVTYMGSVSPSHIQPSSGLTFAQLFSWAGVWALIAFGQPQLVTKFMGLRDSRTVGTVIRVAVVWEIIFMVSIAMIGAAAFKLFRAVPFDNVDAIVPTLVAEHTNAVVSGIFLCGILAAGLSTTVALVLTSSGAVTKDIYEDYYCARSNAKQDSGKSVRISRIATGIILVVVVIGSIYPPDFIWSLSTMSAGVMGAAFTAPLVLGLYWKRATRQGCMAGIIGGSAVSIIWYFAGLTSVMHSFVPGTAVSFLLMVLVSLCTPRMEEEHLDVFFEPGCSKNKIQAAIAAGSK